MRFSETSVMTSGQYIHLCDGQKFFWHEEFCEELFRKIFGGAYARNILTKRFTIYIFSYIDIWTFTKKIK